MAECYEEGKGVSKNLKQAAKLYKEAVNQGSEQAKDKLKELDLKPYLRLIRENKALKNENRILQLKSERLEKDNATKGGSGVSERTAQTVLEELAMLLARGDLNSDECYELLNHVESILKCMDKNKIVDVAKENEDSIFNRIVKDFFKYKNDLEGSFKTRGSKLNGNVYQKHMNDLNFSEDFYGLSQVDKSFARDSDSGMSME